MAAELGLAPAGSRDPSLSPVARKRRTPAGSPEPMAIEVSPKRFSDGTSTNWNEVPSPAAPSRDMTLTELTHAYQHLAAQAAHDKVWVKTVEMTITDHALWLDRHSQAGDAIMHQVEMRLKRQSDATVTTTTKAQPADTTDEKPRAHVQAQDAAVTARLDQAEAALQATLSALDGTLRAHTQEAVGATQAAVEALAAQVHLLDTARGLTANSPSPSATAGGRWREQDPQVGAFRVRIQEVETKQAEANAKAYALEADLFNSLAKLSDRADATAQALGQQLDSLCQAVLASQED